MVHQVYIGNYEFNSIINGSTSTIIRTFVLDPAIIAEDYVIFINRENKKRTMVRITDSEKKSRNIIAEMYGADKNDKAYLLEKMYAHYEENIKTSVPYKIDFETANFEIEFPIEKEHKISEITILIVSNDGIGLKMSKDLFVLYKFDVNEKHEIAQIKTKVLDSFGLKEDEVIIPLLKYSIGKGQNETYGQAFLIQPKFSSKIENIDFFKPISAVPLSNGYERKMLTETLEFELERERYIFWILETLFLNDDIPENELGFVDEPETIADILCNRIKCLHDILYLDYNDFVGDNFRIYVEPHLTNSQCFERTTKLALTEENYQQVMNELIYNPAFAEWALNYDRERTLNDKRYINEWLQ